MWMSSCSSTSSCSCISRMKSLFAPTFSHLFPSKPSNSSPFPLHYPPSFRLNPNFLSPPPHLPLSSSSSSSSSMSSSNSFNTGFRCYGSSSAQAPASASGEIHVIVGPMFAGKTTTLLRRVQSESRNGRFFLFPSSLLN